MASYLFAFIVGPYEYVTKEAVIPGQIKPLRVRYLSRKSLFEKMQEMFDIMHHATVIGIKWYSEFFGVNYPWPKLD